jgi:hypothetical protein
MAHPNTGNDTPGHTPRPSGSVPKPHHPRGLTRLLGQTGADQPQHRGGAPRIVGRAGSDRFSTTSQPHRSHPPRPPTSAVRGWPHWKGVVVLTWLKLVCTSARMLMRALRRSSDSGSAAVRVRLPTSTFDDASAGRIVNEFLFAPTRLSFDTVLVMTGGGDPPSWLSVVVGAGRVHTTTSRRARRWARGTVAPRAGVSSAHAPAILHRAVARSCR